MGCHVELLIRIRSILNKFYADSVALVVKLTAISIIIIILNLI